jgi:hypothetical protein
LFGDDASGRFTVSKERAGIKSRNASTHQLQPKGGVSGKAADGSGERGKGWHVRVPAPRETKAAFVPTSMIEVWSFRRNVKYM